MFIKFDKIGVEECHYLLKIGQKMMLKMPRTGFIPKYKDASGNRREKYQNYTCNARDHRVRGGRKSFLREIYRTKGVHSLHSFIISPNDF
jgi:hypothetical protein